MDSSLSALLNGQKSEFKEERKSKILPSYNWYVRYHYPKQHLSVYLSGALTSGLAISPQQISWTRSDSYSISLQKFFFNYQLECSVMWSMPLHLFMRSNKAELSSDAYRYVTRNDDYRRKDNQIMVSLAWRFKGGQQTRKYSRKSGHINI